MARVGRTPLPACSGCRVVPEVPQLVAFAQACVCRRSHRGDLSRSVRRGRRVEVRRPSTFHVPRNRRSMCPRKILVVHVTANHDADVRVPLAGDALGDAANEATRRTKGQRSVWVRLRLGVAGEHQQRGKN